LALQFSKKCSLKASSTNYDPDFDRMNGMPVWSINNYNNNANKPHYQNPMPQPQQ